MVGSKIKNALVRRGVLLLAGAALTGAAQAGQLSLGQATGYNIFALSNFSESGTDSQGRVAVGGNFTPTGGGAFAIATNLSDPASTYDLVVGGSYTNGNIQNITGSVVVGGSATWTNPSVGGTLYAGGSVTTSNSSATLGGLVVNGSFSSSSVTINNSANAYVSGAFNVSSGSDNGGTIYAGTYGGPNYLTHAAYNAGTAPSVPTPINFSTAATSLDQLTSQIAGMTANGTVNATANSLTLTGADASQNVFNVTAAQVNAAVASGASGITINAPAGSTVIINVSGTTISALSSQITLNNVTGANVLWNFSGATAFNTTNFAWWGTVLAPYATFTGSSGQFNGQLIASVVTGSTEFHDNAMFAGTITSAAVPEPSTGASALGGCVLIGLGLVARRRVSGSSRR